MRIKEHHPRPKRLEADGFYTVHLSLLKKNDIFLIREKVYKAIINATNQGNGWFVDAILVTIHDLD